MLELRSRPAFAETEYRRADTHMLARDFAVISVRTRDAAFIEKARTSGISLPHAMNSALVHEGSWIATTQPGAWKIFCPVELRTAFLTALSAISPALTLITDLSDGTPILEIWGPGAAGSLSCDCPLDLDARTFKPGDCANSLLLGIPISLIKISDGPHFLLSFDRAHAHTLWDWLAHATDTYLDEGAVDRAR